MSGKFHGDFSCGRRWGTTVEERGGGFEVMGLWDIKRYAAARKSGGIGEGRGWVVEEEYGRGREG